VLAVLQLLQQLEQHPAARWLQGEVMVTGQHTCIFDIVATCTLRIHTPWHRVQGGDGSLFTVHTQCKPTPRGQSGPLRLLTASCCACCPAVCVSWMCRYCSVECQQAHRQQHKNLCGKLR
jgi:hypothetical protein